jgi:branched-chain amino acid transport system substrate-binding protein
MAQHHAWTKTGLGLVGLGFLGGVLWGCPPPATKCQTDADCDTTVRYCADGVCTALSGRASDGGTVTPDAGTPDAGPMVPAVCVVIGAPLDSSTAAGPTIRLGALLPKTKADSSPDPRGRLREQAIRLVVEALNPPARQGVNGRTLTFLSCDSAGNATLATPLAQQLVNLGVNAIISSGSTETLAVSAVTVNAGVLLLSSSATTAELTDLPDHASSGGAGLVWRTAASDAFQGSVLSSILKNDRTCVPTANAKAAVIYLGDAYGQGLYNVFRRDYGVGNQQGWQYDRSGDITSAVTQAATYAPNALVIIGFPDDAVRIVDAVAGNAAFTSVPLLLTDSAKAPGLFAGTMPSRLEGACGTAPAPADPLSDAYLWFGQEYMQKFGEDPLSASFVANTYDATMLLAIAAAWATQPGRTLSGQSLADGLTHLSAVDGGVTVVLDPPTFNTAVSNLAQGHDINVEGVSGALDFDNDKGEAPARVQVWRAADGGFLTLRTETPMATSGDAGL